MFDRLRLPQGVRDFPPDKAEEIKKVEELLQEEFYRWGYRSVITPLFEFHETISAGLGEDLKDKVLKFVDPSTGDIVALRPDITPQVGRIVATQLRDYGQPLRLCYNGRVVRFEEKGSGKEREVFQVGCELIGPSSPEADGEIIALSIKSLGRVGIKKTVLDIGHNGLLRNLLGKTGNVRRDIEEALKKKDQEELTKVTRHPSVPEDIRDTILALPELYGSIEILDKARDIRGIRRYVDELTDVLKVIDEFQLNCEINIDLGEIRGFNYYTGVTFEVLSSLTPSPLLRGGRYDELIGRYGYESAATGFAVDIESVLNVTRTHLKNDQIHFVVIPRKANLRREAIRLAEWLRSSGFKVVLDLIADSNLRKFRIKENDVSNYYGVIFLETPTKIKLIEARSGASREFANLEELLKGGI